jgi:alkylation response protein AidB-like acyl-CoA dehydrogenase
MDIELSAEQRVFRDSCAKLAADLAARWSAGRGPHDVERPEPDSVSWGRIVDAGWLALGLHESNGGLGATMVDLCVLAEQLGAHTVPAAVLGTLIAAEQLQTWGADASLLESIADGSVRVAPALSASLLDFGADLAFDAAGATLCVVPTTGTAHATGTGHALGTAHALGEPRPFADVTRIVRPLAEPTSTLTLVAPSSEALARLDAFALALLVAELLGAAQAALAAALDHARVRSQFGAIIGSFQQVQQILAESHVLVEAMRSATYYVAWAVDALPGPAALRAARVAKAFASRSAVEVCENAVQVFGGIGMTWEHPAHLWLRRVQASRLAFGNEHHHQRVLSGA